MMKSNRYVVPLMPYDLQGKGIINHKALLYGNTTMLLNGMVGRYATQDSMIFSRACADHTLPCQSLDQLYAFYLQTVARLHYQQDEDLSPYDHQFSLIAEMMRDYLPAKLESSVRLLIEETKLAFVRVNTSMNALGFTVIPLAIVGLLALVLYSQYVKRDIETCRRLLSMLPPQVMIRETDIRRYLKYGVINYTPKEAVITRLDRRKSAMFGPTITGATMSAGNLMVDSSRLLPLPVGRSG